MIFGDLLSLYDKPNKQIYNVQYLSSCCSTNSIALSPYTSYFLLDVLYTLNIVSLSKFLFKIVNIWNTNPISEFQHPFFINLKIQQFLTYEEKPIQILEHDVQKLRTKEISLVKIRWRNYRIENATWELEEEIQRKDPKILSKNV